MKKVAAVAYFRTSSAANVGTDKDSERRQREAVTAFAKSAGFQIVAEFFDAAVSGADPIESRAGFAALLDRIEGNGVRTVIVEDATRFARDLITQETGIIALIGRGVRVLTSAGDDLTATDDPFKIAMRQIAGAFAQLEKARLVAKLRHARERIRAEKGRCEGRKPIPAEVVAEARRLARKNPRTGERRSLRQIAEELAKLGHVGPSGKPYFPASITHMLES
jgi:DNA invertase Pin-like site-specific DNA recombinase